MGLTISGVLDNAAANWPDKDALVVSDQGVRWSWKDLGERARILAVSLLAAGLEPGDRITAHFEGVGAVGVSFS